MKAGSILLRRGESSLTIIPALGGKISSLRLGGREWLWTSDVLRYRVPDEDTRADDTASYVKTADTGGFDECFPTVGACVIPEDAPAFGGLRLPDHGELWSQQPTLELARSDHADLATARWVGRRMPYTFERTVQLDDEGRVIMRYAVTNDGDDPIPFLWSAHPLLPLTSRTRVHLPPGARMRLDATHNLNVVNAGSELRWPLIPLESGAADISRPASVADGYACKLFVDLPAGAVRASLDEDGGRLDVSFDGDDITHFGVWINNRGWTPFEGGTPYCNIAFEPCIGAPDSLAVALEGWDSAAWLAPGQTRIWSMTWSATRT